MDISVYISLTFQSQCNIDITLIFYAMALPLDLRCESVMVSYIGTLPKTENLNVIYPLGSIILHIIHQHTVIDGYE